MDTATPQETPTLQTAAQCRPCGHLRKWTWGLRKHAVRLGSQTRDRED